MFEAIVKAISANLLARLMGWLLLFYMVSFDVVSKCDMQRVYIITT
jgi:hypothetical protein